MTPEERERYQAFLKRADEEIQTVILTMDTIIQPYHAHTTLCFMPRQLFC